MTAEQVLAAAADLVEFSGDWGQGGGETLCAHLAICRVARSCTDVHAQARRALVAEISGDHSGSAEYMDSVWAFNDAPGRTAVEVAAAIRNSKRWLQ